eukprot:403353341
MESNSTTTQQQQQSPLDQQTLYKLGVEALRETASILICNWTDLNYAIEQGLSTKNRKLNLEDEKEIEQLKELVSYLKSERQSDMALRNQLIQHMVDISLSQEVELEDYEDCLLDFMELNFNMVIEDNSAKEIGRAIMKIRHQLFSSAQNKSILESEELEKLREFNEQKNQAKKRRQEKEAEEKKQRGSDSEEDGSEDDDEEMEEDDGNGDSKSKKDVPELIQAKPTGPVIDADGFEMVTTEKKGRRR